MEKGDLTQRTHMHAMKRTTPHPAFYDVMCQILFPALLVGLLSVGPVSADRSVRCEGRIVSIGTFKEEVRNKCGEPDHLEEWEEGQNTVISQYYDYEKERYILPRVVPGPIRMERWTYNFGSNRLIHYLYFKNGELYRIETGEKGSD
jgi:hypothetical protein